MPDHFAPFAPLAAELMPHFELPDGDGSHDIAHLLRVWRNVQRIHADEGGDLKLLAAATLLHDCVAVEKNDTRRAQASTLAADKATKVLSGLGWSQSDTTAIHHIIAAHSFSANIPPETTEEYHSPCGRTPGLT